MLIILTFLQDYSDKPKQRSFWKKIGRRNSHSAGVNLRRTSSLKRVSSSPEGKAHRPLSPKLSSPPFDFRNVSDHSSSHSSSPASSPSSPSTQYTRPGELLTCGDLVFCFRMYTSRGRMPGSK